MKLRGNEQVDITETLPMVDYVIGDTEDDVWSRAVEAFRDELRDSSDEISEPEPF